MLRTLTASPGDEAHTDSTVTRSRNPTADPHTHTPHANLSTLPRSLPLPTSPTGSTRTRRTPSSLCGSAARHSTTVDACGAPGRGPAQTDPQPPRDSTAVPRAPEKPAIAAGNPATRVGRGGEEVLRGE